VAADVVVALGFLVIFFVFRENTYTSATIEVAADQVIISSGPYSVVRHPMYAGALLMLLSTPVALGSWWAILMFIPLCAVIVRRLSDEERFLSANLPGYGEYRARVQQRLIPRAW
jgi:protein-S-isoprenylcysteine O-methyltransferase Ste14